MNISLPNYNTPSELIGRPFDFKQELSDAITQIRDINTYTLFPFDEDVLNQFSASAQINVNNLIRLAGFLSRFEQYEGAYFFYHCASIDALMLWNTGEPDGKNLVYRSLLGVGRLLLTYFGKEEMAYTIFVYINHLIPDGEASQFI
jgi:hypothetical protein